MCSVCFYNFSRTLLSHTSWEGTCASMSFLIILINSSMAPPFLLSYSWIPWQLIICLFWHHLTRVSMDNSVERYLSSLAGPGHIIYGGVRMYISSILCMCAFMYVHMYMPIHVYLDVRGQHQVSFTVILGFLRQGLLLSLGAIDLAGLVGQ